MKKKMLSIVFTLSILMSIMTAGFVNANAAVDSEGRYVPSENIKKTSHLLFYMPDNWYNEEFGVTGVGAYWWVGLDACGSVDGTSVGASWPGYKIHLEDADNSIYYVDFPMDTPDGMSPILFNNFLDGGDANVDEVTGEIVYDISKEQYAAAKQTTDICATYYSKGDNDYYDDLLDRKFFSLAETALKDKDYDFFGDYKDNFFIHEDWGISFTFDNMIYVIDPAKSNITFKGKETCVGEWYFYYGDGNYGPLPSKDMAVELGLIKNLDPSVEPETKPTTPTSPPPCIKIYGDANSDDKISILDATEIQKHLAQLIIIPTEDIHSADANGDGVISILDVTEIQKYLAKVQCGNIIGTKYQLI